MFYGSVKVFLTGTFGGTYRGDGVGGAGVRQDGGFRAVSGQRGHDLGGVGDVVGVARGNTGGGEEDGGE